MTDTTQSSSPVLPSLSSAEETYRASANCKKTLLAMAVGIRMEDTGDLLADLDDTRLLNRTIGLSKKTKYLPTVQVLFKEITRRTELYNITPKFKGKKQKPILIQFLTDNKLHDPADVEFLTRTVNQFKRTLQVYQEAQENATREVQAGAWHGHQPFLRLIHCVLDTDDMRREFQLSYRSPSREDLDGRNTVALPSARFWKKVADLFENDSFIPRSLPYGHLHSDFGEDVDLSVAGFKITPEKAKAKFVTLQASVNKVKARWEMSGSGDGTITENGEVLSTSKCAFLHGDNPCCLYLWEYAKTLNVLATVQQQVEKSIALNGSNVPTTKKSNKKRKSEVQLTTQEHSLLKELSSTSFISKCSCLEHDIRETEKILLEYQMKKMEVMDRIEEMEESPDMFSEKAVSRKRNAATLLETHILSQTEKLNTFIEQLESIRREKSTSGEEEQDGDDSSSSSSEEE